MSYDIVGVYPWAKATQVKLKAQKLAEVRPLACSMVECMTPRESRAIDNRRRAQKVLPPGRQGAGGGH
jgi:hypothetical protein